MMMAISNAELIKRARRRSRKRGLALLMVMGALSLMTLMLTEFQDAASAELGSAMASRDQVKAEYAARSGVNLARLPFAAEPTIRKPLALLGVKTQIPVWEFTDVLLGPFNDTEAAEIFTGISGLSLDDTRNLGLDGAGFDLQIVDEDSKLNLNLAARADSFSQQRMVEQLFAMFRGPAYDELFEEKDEKGNRNDRQAICSALIDWVDPNQDRNNCDPTIETNIAAAPEDSFYQSLDRPYRRKNAAFDSLEEVHLVRGVSERFYRTFFQKDLDDPKSRVVTVWGTGKLNINTANPLALLSVACSKATPESKLCYDEEMQANMLFSLKMLSSMMPALPIFSSPKSFISAIQGKGKIGSMLTDMSIEPIQLLSTSEVEKALSVESKVFSIYATGRVKSGKRTTVRKIHAVVDMRGAPPPWAAPPPDPNNPAGVAVNAGAGAPPLTPANPDEPDALPMAQRPEGNMIYYRVD
ncbi:MAG: type II secretion system protein GspK [Polyangiaceae bacterium]|nr:type II secretion system protein GspK [Polyangiaceae bacterium]